MNSGSRRLYFRVFALLLFLVTRCSAHTDNSDVEAIQYLYRSLNTPPQLKGWKLTGGDPCQESWTGVSCVGSAIIQIKIDNLNISGKLGYGLKKFHHLQKLDVSNNNINGLIPFSLPATLTHLDLACNYLTQYLPYSFLSLTSIQHMNLSHNRILGPVGNVFTDLSALKEMDLSFNRFTGNLPSSIATLTSLSRLFLQNNEFTGSVIFLARLHLTDLNIQDNHFSGIIPKEFQYIHNLWLEGNMFDKDDPPSPEPSAFKSNPKRKRFEEVRYWFYVCAFLVCCVLLLIAMIHLYKNARKRARHSVIIIMIRVVWRVNRTSPPIPVYL